MRSRTPDNAKADREFSQTVKARDGGICRFERYRHGRWEEHGIKGSPLNPIDASHIYGRPHLSPSTRFDARVGLAGCRDCHTQYDSYSDLVRVPPAREADAYDCAIDGCRVPPVRRMPPERPE